MLFICYVIYIFYFCVYKLKNDLSNLLLFINNNE